MLNTTKLAPDVLRDIAFNMDYDETKDIEPFLFEMAQLSVEDAFERYCTWNNIPGFGKMLMDALDNLREAEMK